jgi:hypothetical protein
MLNNNVLDELFNEVAYEDESFFYYFYTMKMAATSEYIKFGPGAFLENQHQVICFTNKRIMMLELNALTGKFNGNKIIIDIEDVEGIKSKKKGLIKSKVIVTLKDNKGDIIMNPNSFTIGLSNLKKNLVKLQEMYT